jgi:hypothetical protein
MTSKEIDIYKELKAFWFYPSFKGLQEEVIKEYLMVMIHLLSCQLVEENHFVNTTRIN